MQNLLQNPIIQGLLTSAIWEWGKATKEMVEDFALQAYINKELKSLEKKSNTLDSEFLEAVKTKPEELSRDLAKIAQSVPQEIKEIESKDKLKEALKSFLNREKRVIYAKTYIEKIVNKKGGVINFN